MHPSEWDALRAEDEQDYRDRTGAYAPFGQPTYPRRLNPACGHLETSLCGGCGTCTSCDGCYCGED